MKNNQGLSNIIVPLKRTKETELGSEMPWDVYFDFSILISCIKPRNACFNMLQITQHALVKFSVALIQTKDENRDDS